MLSITTTQTTSIKLEYSILFVNVFELCELQFQLHELPFPQGNEYEDIHNWAALAQFLLSFGSFQGNCDNKV